MGADRVQTPPKENSEPAKAERIDAQDKTPEPSASYHSSAGVSLAGAAQPGDLPLSRDNLMFLQRAIGNRGVVRLMRSKGKFGRPEGKDEPGAGRMPVQMGSPRPSPAPVQAKLT